MGAVRKAGKSIGGPIGGLISKVGENPWMIGAAVAAPWAVGALGGLGGGGFMQTALGGAQMMGNFATSFLPGGAAPGAAHTGMFGATGGGIPMDTQAQRFMEAQQVVANNATQTGQQLGLTQQMKDPSFLGGMFKRAAMHLAGSAMAGDGLSDAERKLMESMAKDMGNLRDREGVLWDKQMDVSDEILQAARQIDPEYEGLKAQRDVQIAGGVSTRQAERDAALQQGRAGLSAGDRRRAALDTTRQAQSAYLEARESGQDRKLAALGAGRAAMPGDAPTGAMTAGLEMAPLYRQQEIDRGEAAESAGALMQEVVFGDKPKSKGGLDIGTAGQEKNA